MLILKSIENRIADDLQVKPAQVLAAVRLLDEGATVPFIARYRKEATDGLDDTQLRQLEDRLGYLRELEARKQTILASISEQGKLTDALTAEIQQADTKQKLEDLYLPYKPKRRTKAQIAREAGLTPLAETLWQHPDNVPEQLAEGYLNVDAGFADVKQVLDGARQILMEQFSEDAALLDSLRTYLTQYGKISARVIEGKEMEGSKFRDWFDFSEAFADMPSHRILALFRGRAEGILRLSLVAEHDETLPHPCIARIMSHCGIRDQGRAADAWLVETARWAWNVKMSLHLELDLMGQLRERAEAEAIRVFSRNLKDLLLAAPAGTCTTMGLDPGIRTGVKVAVVSDTGKVLDTATIYPFEPRNDRTGALTILEKLVKKHNVQLIAIGNGTHSRETDKLAEELIKCCQPQKVLKVVVSEAGASVYSASELAAKEFPDLDVSLRGAVSIARRLQDPLAELVKIDPKAIGVGQYQHDVNQHHLAKSLDAVVEDCVNAVGVDLNTASAPLLSRVSGLNSTLAGNIVAYRDANGAFRNREQLKEVPRLGAKTFEQAAGFLRVINGDNPLDASAVHPEAYPLVQRILDKVQKNIREMMGDSSLKKIVAENFVDEHFGLPTVKDVLSELEKPGRDPRPEFKAVQFMDGVERLEDLLPGMMLEGVVTNVANFGAFVDIGVHQDGLVHVSALSDSFVKDPHSVVKTGDIVRVRVLEVDLPRRRISLSMRKTEPADAGATLRVKDSDGRGKRQQQQNHTRPVAGKKTANSGNTMAEALARALNR